MNNPGYVEALRRTAELRVQLDLAEGRVPVHGVPHYSVIEDSAHEAGQAVSRMAQQIHMNELTARHIGTATCPTCHTHCELEGVKREVVSGDGEVQLQELKGYCPSCRKAFFPDAGSIGV